MPAYDGVLFDPPAPTARVVLRNPDTGVRVTDVQVLIDTGADVTLLPRVSLVSLGISINPDEEYELRGFDGSASVAQVVRLDLIFLRRSFKGRFLLFDQECGILGRDVLNHVTVLLDGLRLTWHE